MPQLEEALTIKEAAERLRVSPDTVRRRIRRGELKAFKQQGPYGEEWRVPASEVAGPYSPTDVVPTTRQVTLSALENMIKACIEERDHDLQDALVAVAEKQAELARVLDALREEIARAREEERIAQAERDRILEERDRKLTEALRSLTEKRRPWWARILKQGDRQHER